MTTRKSESIEVAHVRTDEQDLERIDLASQESVTFATTVTSDSPNGDSEAASSSSVASASQTRVAPIQNRPPRVWDGTASSQYIAVGPRTSNSVQFHKCIPFQFRP